MTDDIIDRLTPFINDEMRIPAGLIMDIIQEIQRLQAENEDCNNDFHALKEMFDKIRSDRNRWRKIADQLFLWLHPSPEDDSVYEAGIEAMTMYEEAASTELHSADDSDYTLQLEHSNTWLTNVHPADACAPYPCTIHNRTDHRMRSFPQHWRDDRQIMERICPHGVGHPDPDERFEPEDSQWIHGCDGCCLGA